MNESMDNTSKSIKGKVISSFENFKTAPFRTASYIMIICANITGITNTLFLYLRFFITDGYKKRGTLGYGYSSEDYFQGVPIIILGLLLSLSLFALYISYIKMHKGIKKVTMTVLLIMSVILLLVPILLPLLFIVMRNTTWFINHYSYLQDYIQSISKTYIIIFFISFILPMLLFFLDEYFKPIIKNWLFSMIISFFVLPLFLTLIVEPAGLVIGIAILLFIGIRGLKKQCPHCKKWFALKRIDSWIVNERNISIRREVERRSYQTGEILSVEDTYIPGTETTYEHLYVCKHCGQQCNKRTIEKGANE